MGRTIKNSSGGKPLGRIARGGTMQEDHWGGSSRRTSRANVQGGPLGRTIQGEPYGEDHSEKPVSQACTQHRLLAREPVTWAGESGGGSRGSQCVPTTPLLPLTLGFNPPSPCLPHVRLCPGEGAAVSQSWKVPVGLVRLSPLSFGDTVASHKVNE